MKKTLGNTRKLRNKRGKKTKKVLRGGASPMDKTDALRIKITEIVKEGNGVSEISDSQKNIIFDLIKGKKNLYYLSYNRKQQQKEKDESMIILPEGLQEYTVLVIDSIVLEDKDKPKDKIAEGIFKWSEGEGTFFILNKTYRRDGKPLEGSEKIASELEKISKLKTAPPTVVEENEWELLSTKDKNTGFDKYYIPLLNLISEQHFNGILTGEFKDEHVRVQGDKVKFVAGKGNIFQYKLNEGNKLEECESKYPNLKDKLKETCNESLGEKRQDILDDDNIRENVKKLVYADLYNLKNIFTETNYENIKNIELSRGNSKYSETTETLETVVNLFETE